MDRMRALWPQAHHGLDPWALYRPDDPDAPLLRLNMVAGVDGAATDRHGHTAELGGPGDWEVFRTLRAQADVVLVGAGTARREGYGPARLRRDLAARRRDDLGRARRPAIVLVSRSLALDPASPIFAEADPPTAVLTCAGASAERRARLEPVATVLTAGGDHVDLVDGLARIRQVMGPVITCEGGPSLNASLLRAGVVDELCVTLAPQLVGVPSAPRLAGGLDEPAALSLRQVAIDDTGELYLRYRLAHREGAGDAHG
jgi:riboflavin biosynthesis pyrimidine reductase